MENRTIGEDTVAELAAIYRAAGIRALARCGRVVDISRLYARAKKGTRNPYAFRVRLAWVRELRRAGTETRAEVYRTLRLADQTASMADLMQLRDVLQGNWGEVRTSEIWEAPTLAAEAPRDRGAWKSSARIVRHARECLVAHWSLSGGQRWQAALAADLAMLAECLRVARGEGHDRLGEWDSWHNSSQRRAIVRMQARMASGDALMTDEPERADEALQAWQGARGETRSACRAARAAEMADYMVCS
jgi:hypothetical protein